MSIDPRKGCLLMKRPVAWRRAKQAAPAKPEVAKAPERTYQFSPRGDLDAIAKFFAGDTKK